MNNSSIMTPEQTKERSDKVKAASLPLIKLLAEEFHPHHNIIVTCNGYELLEIIQSTTLSLYK